MKRAPKNRTIPDLGYLSLPVMCALLAGLVYATVGAAPAAPTPEPAPAPVPEPEPAPLPEPPAPLPPAEDLHELVGELEAQLAERQQLCAALVARLQELLARKQELEAEVSAADLARAELQRLGEQRAALEAEVAALHQRLDELQTELQDHRDRVALLGSYSGPYLLIEVVEGGAIVHPGGLHLTEVPAASDLPAFWELVDGTPFVAFAVRPAGFKTAFSAVRALVIEHLQARSSSAPGTGLSFFPLGADESIDPYLPKEVSR